MTGVSTRLAQLEPAVDRMPVRAVLAASGGLDSTVLACWLHARGVELLMLSADYGQRHDTELRCAAATAARLDARHHVVDLKSVGSLLSGSALTDPRVGVPDGHYTDESMRATVVPNRNAILLDLAVGGAIAAGADSVAFAAHAGDRAVYPDCRPEFVDAYAAMVAVANDGFLPAGFTVLAPFIAWSKAQIVALGAALSVPFGQTWSCYRGGQRHCGTCGTCVERREAFTLAGVVDPTEYELLTGEVG